MTWGDGTSSLTCEECGHVDRFENFIWVLGEVPVCQNGAACHRRRDRLARIEEMRNKPPVTKKRSWLTKIFGQPRSKGRNAN